MTTTLMERFVAHIAEQADEKPAVRAALRSGLGREPEHCHRMHRYLAPWLPYTPNAHRERAFYTVASLIARAPETAIPHRSPGDLGDSFALAAVNRDLAPRTCSRYLQLLTKQPPEALFQQLVIAVMALRDKDVPVDFTKLLTHVDSWPTRQDRIAKNWLQHYFRTAPDEDTGDQAD
jgi:CRISPR system Cascade subunit CasB